MGVVTGPDQVRPGMLLKLLQYTGLPHSGRAMGGVRSCSWLRLIEKYSKSSLCWRRP